MVKNLQHAKLWETYLCLPRLSYFAYFLSVSNADFLLTKRTNHYIKLKDKNLFFFISVLIRNKKYNDLIKFRHRTFAWMLVLPSGARLNSVPFSRTYSPLSSSSSRVTGLQHTAFVTGSNTVMTHSSLWSVIHIPLGKWMH